MRENFLAALTVGCTVTAAANRAGVHRTTVYVWRGADKEFAAAWDDAYEQGSDHLEDEARRRAVDGVTKPLMYKGKKCGSIQEYSDTLMITLLKARRPERFRDNAKVEHGLSESLEALVLGSLAPKAE